jgi:hypothetical protein
MRTDIRTDVTTLIGNFREYANEPEELKLKLSTHLKFLSVPSTLVHYNNVFRKTSMQFYAKQQCIQERLTSLSPYVMIHATAANDASNLFKILFISRFYTSVATARSGPLQGLYKT